MAADLNLLNAIALMKRNQVANIPLADVSGRTARIPYVVRHCLLGVRNGIPLCCIVRFILDAPDFPSGWHRGTKTNRWGRFVPCLWIHRADVLPEIANQERNHP